MFVARQPATRAVDVNSFPTISATAAIDPPISAGATAHTIQATRSSDHGVYIFEPAAGAIRICTAHRFAA